MDGSKGQDTTPGVPLPLLPALRGAAEGRVPAEGTRTLRHSPLHINRKGSPVGCSSLRSLP